MNKDLIKKLTSRKFIVTLIPAITGIITLFIGENAIVNTISSLLMVVAPTIVYCIVEGVCDAKSIKTITEASVKAAEELGASDNTTKVIEQIGEVGVVLTEDETTDNSTLTK